MRRNCDRSSLGSVLKLFQIDEDMARKYAIIYSSLVKKGKKIPINDAWIAACCMEVGGTLVTRDRHFETVEQIDLGLKLFVWIRSHASIQQTSTDQRYIPGFPSREIST